MIVLNELVHEGMRRLELYADDVLTVSNVPSRPGTAEIDTIDGRRFLVSESVDEVFCMLEEGDAQPDL